MRHGYPILLDLSRRSVLIVGGGAVASRKAAGVLAAGATDVRAVAPKFVRDFPPDVRQIVESYTPAHLDGAGLVFAATDSAAVNDSVVAEARKRGLLVGRAEPDESDPADFISPAVLRLGAVTISVSAAGSAALAAALRDQLSGTLSDEWINLADALYRLRPTIKSLGLPIARRREIFRALSTEKAAAIQSTDGIQGLWDWIQCQFPELPQMDFKSPVPGSGE
ncbi:MAG: NAD(P)-dependent oxidoreductase [Tepidisphaeraceae bacterium]|jgi:precorrin-2 dehydrogenase/sirohydrochlorin ferrochelatase